VIPDLIERTTAPSRAKGEEDKKELEKRGEGDERRERSFSSVGSFRGPLKRGHSRENERRRKARKKVPH